MKYDRDIFRVRFGAWILLGGNLGAAVWNLVHHNWSVAMACVIWAYNSALVVKTAATQQATRDLGRVIEAGLHAMRRELEED
jgi:hypothetical protein